MNGSAGFAILSFLSVSALMADESLDRARQQERSGDASGARLTLAHAAQSKPSDMETLFAYAGFLERYGDPEARNVYRKILNESAKSNNRTQASEAARR